MIEIIQQHLSEILTGLFSLVSGLFVGRKTKKAEAQTAEASALKEMQEAYGRFVLDEEKKYKSMREELENLQAKVRNTELHWQDKLNQMEQHWQVKIDAVEKQWQTKYDRLKRQFDDYKKGKG